jgi:hypothetical protein
MAKQFKERERFKNLEVARRLRERPGLRIARLYAMRYQPAHNDWFEQDAKYKENFAWSKRILEKSVYKGICRFSREFFHPIWRQAGKNICRLYLIGEDTRADNLDPQPKRLGIMWDID